VDLRALSQEVSSDGRWRFVILFSPDSVPVPRF